MPSIVKPTPISLVVCDNIYREPGGKSALVGLFNKITTHSLPVVHPRMAVFVSVTGLRADSTAKLDIVHGETDQPIVTAQGPFPNGHTPLSVVDMNFILNSVPFSDKGTYFIRFWANEHLLLQRPFEVQLIKKRGQKKEAGDNE